jgi:nickel-dependent lactate racemase
MGFEPKNITLIIATGTHLPMKSEEFDRILPQEISQRYTVLSHDCDDAQNLVFTGKTAHGTEVWVNKNYAQAELKIVLGNIEPHHFMGFSGGVKSASIGLTGRKTIDQNHSFLLDPESKIAAYETNPMRMDVEDIGKLIGVDFALNIILAPDKKVASVLAGQPERVMETGIPSARSVCQVKVSQKYDLVIASVGGYPKDLNLYQSQKAVTNAAMITREGGVVILAAECPEESGSKSYEDFMQGVVSYDGVFEKFNRNGFRVGPHKAIQFARIGQKAHMVLVSAMNPDLVRQLLLDPAASMDNALEIAGAYLNKEIIDVALMPHAPTTVPDLD